MQFPRSSNLGLNSLNRPTPEIFKVCTDLRKRGYRIALDDFVYSSHWDALIDIADFIKVDILASSRTTVSQLLERLRGYRGQLLAEKVETREQFEQAKRDGFQLFQGYFFCKPALLKRAKVPSNVAVHLQILRLLLETPLCLKALSEAVRTEPALTYRLLRYVNSPLFGLNSEVTSIQRAIVIAGDDSFRRMATLACAVEISSEQQIEVVRVALTRAKFCETAACQCQLNATTQYMLGLFSLLDVMLQMPLGEALADLALPESVKAALLGADNANACPLRWIVSHEHADFEACDHLAKLHGFPPQALEPMYRAASDWADTLLAT